MTQKCIFHNFFSRLFDMIQSTNWVATKKKKKNKKRNKVETIYPKSSLSVSPHYILCAKRIKLSAWLKKIDNVDYCGAQS